MTPEQQQQLIQTLPPNYARFVQEVQLEYGFGISRVLCHFVGWFESKTDIRLPAHPAEAMVWAINFHPSKRGIGYGEIPEDADREVALAFVIAMLHWDLEARKNTWTKLAEASHRLYMALEEFSGIEPELIRLRDEIRKAAALFNPEIPGFKQSHLRANTLDALLNARLDLSELLQEATELSQDRSGVAISLDFRLKPGRKPKEMLVHTEEHLRRCGFKDAVIGALIDDFGDPSRAEQRVGERRRQRRRHPRNRTEMRVEGGS